MKIQLALVLLAATSLQISAYAADSYELDQKADKLESHAASKEAKATAEQNESATAIDEGKDGSAAKYARKAAIEQRRANKYAKEAHKTEKKAAEKAVKETY